MRKIGRLLMVFVTGVLGFLLVLSGTGLVQLSGQLSLYAGIALLLISGINFILPDVDRDEKDRKNSNIPKID